MADEEKIEESTTRSALEEAFKEPEGKVEAEAKEEVEVEAKPEPGDPLPEEKAEAAPEPLDAPTHWAVEHQEMFRGLDAKAQSFLMDRSHDMEAAHTKRSQEIAPMRKLSEAWEPYMQQVGTTPDQFFNALAQTEHSLRSGTNEQKMNILLGLARDYGVDFRQNGNGEPPSAEEDPLGIHAQIQGAVGPLQQQVQHLTGNIYQQNQAQQQGSEQAAQQQIDFFRNEKGADGKPAHPYYDEVYSDMLALAQAKSATGQPLDIAELYDAASWSNASVRAKMQAAETYKASLASRKAEQQRAARSHTAAGSLAGGGGGGADQPKSLRETIVAAFDAST